MSISVLIALKFEFILILFVFVLILQFLVDESPVFGKPNNMHRIKVVELITSTPDHSPADTDTKGPTISIINPAYPPTVTTGRMVIKGIANDSSGIRSMSAAAHMFPFKGNFPILFASKQVSYIPNDWTNWSIPLLINNTGSYRVVLEVIDNAGNPKYVETTINAALIGKNNSFDTGRIKTVPNIAFVRSTFTEAAYQKHGFYDFYFKYRFPPFGTNITSDLDMLTVKTPGSVSEFSRNDIKHLDGITSLIPVNGTELETFPNISLFWLPFIDHVKKANPNGTVTIMRDEDVHDGHIFYPDSKTNAYDILFLFHNEYVTQQEYDNLKQFVSNGGTIVFIDPNVFYAEVRYDRNNDTITLVKGHDWQFDGNVAKRSVHERWYNETKEWVGGNYLLNFIKSNTSFANNPFNYTHFEEQFVNNPRAKIIIDYGVKFPSNFAEIQSKKNELPVDKKLEDVIVATYTLEYGKGKVIMLGLYGQDLAKEKQFMNFFDKTILRESFCPKFRSCY